MTDEQETPGWMKNGELCPAWTEDRWGNVHTCNKALEHRSDVPHGDGAIWWW